MDIRAKLGGKIRSLRQERSWSQEKFAHECELDRTYIASIEQGKRNVSLVNLEKIAGALGMGLSELFMDL